MENASGIVTEKPKIACVEGIVLVK